MDVSISSRHMAVTPRLEEVIRDKIGQLDRFFDELDSAEVHFAEARNPRISNQQTCEVTLSGHGHHLRSKVMAPDPFAAIDLVEEKLERQIRKLRTKLHNRHKGRGATIRGGGGPGRDGSQGARSGAAKPAGRLGPVAGSSSGSSSVVADSVAETNPASPTGNDRDSDDAELRIVKTKRFHLGPLTPSEAALKMDLLGHGFFFFINSETNRSAVVYRRDDGGIGLIDEAG